MCSLRYIIFKKQRLNVVQHANICIKEKGREGEQKEERIRSVYTYMFAGIYCSPLQRSHAKELLLVSVEEKCVPGGGRAKRRHFCGLVPMVIIDSAQGLLPIQHNLH